MMEEHEVAGVRRVAAHLRSLGPDARPARRLLGVLVEAGASTLEESVARSGARRRDVEHLVKLMGDDAARRGHAIEVVAPAAYASLALPAAARADTLPVAAMEDVLAHAPQAV